MSGMNYEKAWKDLKMYIEILSGMSLRFAESEDMNVDERRQSLLRQSPSLPGSR